MKKTDRALEFHLRRLRPAEQAKHPSAAEGEWFDDDGTCGAALTALATPGVAGGRGFRQTGQLVKLLKFSGCWLVG